LGVYGFAEGVPARQTAMIAGMVAFGIGYGAAQTVTLSIMFQRANRGEHGRLPLARR
jgi:hypothetical protein